jgi:predicted nucleic acid-binding protein
MFPVAVVDAGLARIAIDISTRYQISYWDAAIIAAAESLGAAVLYSEDLSHGQAYGTVRVHDPFRDA